MINQKYGVVYTPKSLSEFVAELLKRASSDEAIKVILDPASGECALLSAAAAVFGSEKEYIGIDVDKEAVHNTKDKFQIYHNDAIMPQNVKKKNFYLIVEEINRGNAPAIFGEVFQLLDRIDDEESEYPVGTSEYAITNSNIAQIVYGDDAGSERKRIRQHQTTRAYICYCK